MKPISKVLAGAQPAPVKPAPAERVAEPEEFLDPAADRLVDSDEFHLPPDADPEDFRKYGFYASKGCYYVATKSSAERVSNFTMRVLFHVRSKSNPRRLIELENQYAEKAQIEVTAEDMVAVARFKALAESQGNFMFWGTEPQLVKIKRKLFRDEMSSQEVTTLGWQPDARAYAWANGFLHGSFTPVNENGMVKLGGRWYFIPAQSQIHQEDGLYENERRFLYKPSDVDLERWVAAFCGAYGIDGLLGIGYAVAALFRDLVQRHKNFFPVLNLFGPPKSGKSTMARSLLCLWGEPQEPYMLAGASTTKGFMRKFSQVRNGVVWLDEYRNDIDAKKVESLKNLYDGVGYERALMSNDARTQTTPVLSACLLSGQELPTISNALMSRLVVIDFKPRDFDGKAAEKLAELERQGLGKVTAELLELRTDFEQGLAKRLEESYRALKDTVRVKDRPVEDRLAYNYAILLSSLQLVLQRWKAPYTWAQAKTHFMDRLKQHGETVAGTNEMRTFWEAVQRLAMEKEIVYGEDFDYDGHSCTLYLRLTRVYPLYMESHRRMYGSSGLHQASLLAYLKTERGYRGFKRSHRFSSSVTSCYEFYYPELEISLPEIAVPGSASQQEELPMGQPDF